MSHRRTLLYVSLLAVASSLTACNGDSDSSSSAQPVAVTSTVDVQQGRLSGNAADANGVINFKGIPFAAPPVGDLRWREPQPALSWNGTRDATQFGANCYEASSNANTSTVPVSTQSEDCLFLNVWTSARTSTDKLPVMVWFHGGGFEIGNVTEAELDGAKLAARGVVTVTINYRLGVLGFLAHPDLDAESSGHSSGMYGMQDMLASLKWLQANVAQFGGDPNNITIMGESAGSHAVGMLMSSSLAKGLFNKAIGESGAFWENNHGALDSHQTAQQRGVALENRMGVSSIAALRAMSALQLSQSNAPYDDPTTAAQTSFSPSLDGYVLTENPYVSFMNGHQSDVPLLAGYNGAEGVIFASSGLPHDTVADYTNAAQTEFGAANMPDFLSLYPAGSVAEASNSSVVLAGDQIISQQTWSWLGLQSRTGHAPAYGYNFFFVSGYTPVPIHTSEVPYVFGNLVSEPVFGGKQAAAGSADYALSDQMQRYWTNFARSGNPNADGLPNWPSYGSANNPVLQFTSGGTTPGPAAGIPRFQFLDRFRSNGVITVSQPTN